LQSLNISLLSHVEALINLHRKTKPEHRC